MEITSSCSTILSRTQTPLLITNCSKALSTISSNSFRLLPSLLARKLNSLLLTSKLIMRAAAALRDYLILQANFIFKQDNSEHEFALIKQFLQQLQEILNGRCFQKFNNAVQQFLKGLNPYLKRSILKYYQQNPMLARNREISDKNIVSPQITKMQVKSEETLFKNYQYFSVKGRVEVTQSKNMNLHMLQKKQIQQRNIFDKMNYLDTSGLRKGSSRRKNSSAKQKIQDSGEQLSKSKYIKKTKKKSTVSKKRITKKVNFEDHNQIYALEDRVISSNYQKRQLSKEFRNKLLPHYLRSTVSKSNKQMNTPVINFKVRKSNKSKECFQTQHSIKENVSQNSSELVQVDKKQAKEEYNIKKTPSSSQQFSQSEVDQFQGNRKVDNQSNSKYQKSMINFALEITKLLQTQNINKEQDQQQKNEESIPQQIEEKEVQIVREQSDRVKTLPDSEQAGASQQRNSSRLQKRSSKQHKQLIKQSKLLLRFYNLKQFDRVKVQLH